MNRIKNYVLPVQVVLVIAIGAIMALTVNFMACGFISAMSSWTFEAAQQDDAMQNFTVIALVVSIIITALWLWLKDPHSFK